jgi:class 3 adenylate cyclase
VLFVDLRSYVGFAESRRSEEIFSTVNRHTETVSQIVQKHSGSVVEFNGDGMMAVFGAPNALSDKERAAVRTALAIVADVEGLDHRGHPISVGIGIATGSAFVGDIQAADRLIWSAIGNTTNLAARLQTLTREFHTAVIVDSPTHAALADHARRFERYEDVPIRGRSEAVDIFVLRRRRSASLDDARKARSAST